MSPSESPTTSTDSDATTPANQPPLLAVVAPRISEAAALAGPFLHRIGPFVRVPHSSTPSQLRATPAVMRQLDAPSVVATDSVVAVHGADHVHVANDDVAVESGTPSDLLEIPGAYVRHYGTRLGVNFTGRRRDINNERRVGRHSALRSAPTFTTVPTIAVHTGDKVCYREFRPDYDAPVITVDGERPDCGQELAVV